MSSSPHRKLRTGSTIIAVLGFAALAAPGTAFAQDDGAQDSSAQDLAKKLSNPISSLISVPFQFNSDWGGGPDDEGYKFTLNVQPVVPVGLSPDVNVIVRTIVPIVYQNDISATGADEFGLGDTLQSFFFSPSAPTKSGIVWGVGPVVLLPTATSKYTGSDKWGGGPTFVLLKQSGQTTIGLLANHVWSFAGSGSRSDVSSTFLQPFVSFTTKKATTYSVNTEATYDWVREKWTVPLNVSVSQLVKVGKQPMSFGITGKYYVASPTGGPNVGIRFTATLLFPKG